MHWANKALLGVSVVSSGAAIISFTLNKWEVEKRVDALPPSDRQDWLDGTYTSRKAAKQAREAMLAQQHAETQPAGRET